MESHLKLRLQSLKACEYFRYLIALDLVFVGYNNRTNYNCLDCAYAGEILVFLKHPVFDAVDQDRFSQVHLTCSEMNFHLSICQTCTWYMA